MAMILSVSQFAHAVKSLRSLDESARGLVADLTATALHQWHSGKNKTPYLALTNGFDGAQAHLNAELPRWLADGIKKLCALGKASAVMTARTCAARGDVIAAMLFQSEQEKRELRKASRVNTPKTKTASTASIAPEPVAQEGSYAEIVELRTIEITNALIVGGETYDLTFEDADMLLAILMQLRTPSDITPLAIAA